MNKWRSWLRSAVRLTPPTAESFVTGQSVFAQQTEKDKDKESLKRREDCKKCGENHWQGVSDGKGSKHPGESKETQDAPQPEDSHDIISGVLSTGTILAIMMFPSCAADVTKLDKCDTNVHDDVHWN